ncbi:hypothetical protein Tco_0070610 [Tanacetum coccineum]
MSLLDFRIALGEVTWPDYYCGQGILTRPEPYRPEPYRRESGMWKDGGERESFASATSTAAPKAWINASVELDTVKEKINTKAENVMELDGKLVQRKTATKTGLDFSDLLLSLENKYQQWDSPGIHLTVDGALNNSEVGEPVEDANEVDI